MRPSTALFDHIEEVRAIIARYPVCNARIFGSVARGDDKDGGDLDILVDAVNGVSFYDLAQLELELEALLGIRVDILTPGGLAPDVAKAVADDLKPLDSIRQPPFSLENYRLHRNPDETDDEYNSRLAMFPDDVRRIV